MARHIVKMPGDQIALELEVLSREPFLDILGKLLEAAPDAETVRIFSEKRPDRFAQAVAIFGRLAGFHDKLQIDASVAIDISRMSDAELMDQLAETEARYKVLNAETA